MTKPVTGQTTFGASTSGTTTQLDNNFLLAYNALNDYNTYGNYLVDSGAVNALVTTVPAGMTGALTDGLVLQVKVKVANTGATTHNYNGGGAIPVVSIDGSALTAGALPINAIVQLQYSSGAASWLLQTPLTVAAAAASQVSVRQAIQSAPMDGNGLSTLIPASCSSLSMITANITASAPLIVAAAAGFTSSGANNLVGISSANLTFNCTANMVNFLGVTVAANGNLTAFTVGNANGVQPTYQWGGSNTNGNGNYTFNIEAMTMAAGNGTAAAQTFTVFVGEANCNSNAVVSGTSYAILARYESVFTATLPTTATVASFNHNIGENPRLMWFEIECTTADVGFVVGNRVINPNTTASGGSVTLPMRSTYKTCAITTGSSAPAFGAPQAATGTAASLTLANWKYRMTAYRGW